MKLNVEDLKTVNLSPGDTLVIRYRSDMLMRIMENFRERLKKMFPNNKILLIPEHIEIYKIISEDKKNGDTQK